MHLRTSGSDDENDQVSQGAYARRLGRHVVGISRMVSGGISPGCFKHKHKCSRGKRERSEYDNERGDGKYCDNECCVR